MKDEKKNTDTPSSASFDMQPDDCFDIVNKYGTYNIQPTSASDNEYPEISQGLPETKRRKLEKESRRFKKKNK